MPSPTATSIPKQAPALGAARQRLGSLDAFRGITIAAMILVNNPGSWRHSYPVLRHADWNGCTPADVIFPFFLFIVGVAVTLTFAGGQHRRMRATLAKVIRRTLLIFALGLFLNGFPNFDWSVIRIFGVLQRIAVCYFFASIVVLTMDVRGQAATAVGLVLGYWALMKWAPVPIPPEGGPQWNTTLAAYVDSLLLHGHMLHEHWDPEGLLSTLPAIATTLAGALTGRWLQKPLSAVERTAGMFVFGNLAIIIGLMIDASFPINKNLWSSSYTVFSAGIALDTLAMCSWLIDVQGYVAWAKPFTIYGTNPLLAYVLSSLLEKLMLLATVTRGDGSVVTLKRYLFETVFLRLAGHAHASFLYALGHVLLWLAVTAVLYRKRIFIRL